MKNRLTCIACVGLLLSMNVLAGCQHAGTSSKTIERTGNPDARCETMLLPGNVPMELVWLRPGEFWMGQNAQEQDAYPNKETPHHRVRISQGFWMGKHEVTQAQWKALMGTAPWSGKRYVSEDPDTPAVYVSWHDAVAFTEKLAAYTEKPFRLPTEAEWEYACRAGTETRFYWGDDPHYEDIAHRAWWRGNALISGAQHARKTGQMPPNPWGLYDMSGNVSEWCQDWHGFYLDAAQTDPTGPEWAEHRVLRGGSWISIGGHCRSSRRHHEVPDAAHSDFGFRVLSAPRPQPQEGAPRFTDVFVAGLDGVDTYRIPSLLIAPDGSLLAFCEARKISQEDASPTDMVLRRSLDGGNTWLPTQTLVRGVGEEALMNPCPIIDQQNQSIVLLCVNINKTAPGHHQHFQLVSRDSGQTWSEPVDIGRKIAQYDDTFVPGPGIGIQMRGGRLVVPGYAGELNEETDELFFSRVMYSDDHGQSWTLGEAVGEMSDEAQAVELSDGRLMLNMRGNMGTSCRGVAVSGDGGATWGRVRWDRALNECPCQASITRCGPSGLNQDRRLLFANPDNAAERFNVVERSKMTVRMSYDDGDTWPVKRLIHAGPSSYSSLVMLPDGYAGLLFEGGEKHRREWIRFARFSLDWLEAGRVNPE